jgi:hypothetical protein
MPITHLAAMANIVCGGEKKKLANFDEPRTHGNCFTATRSMNTVCLRHHAVKALGELIRVTRDCFGGLSP